MTKCPSLALTRSQEGRAGAVACESERKTERKRDAADTHVSLHLMLRQSIRFSSKSREGNRRQERVKANGVLLFLLHSLTLPSLNFICDRSRKPQERQGREREDGKIEKRGKGMTESVKEGLGMCR